MGDRTLRLRNTIYISTVALFGFALGDTPLTTQRVASDLANPIFITSPPGDTQRLFIVEQDGIIRILRGGALLESPFLDIQPVVLNGGERGLLGLAFHPEYAQNGLFFIDYTNLDGNIEIARYRASPGSDVADAQTRHDILTVPHLDAANHNGGWIGFGPDGYLYIATGDGGGQFDPDGHGQNTSALLGKLLRVNVDGDDFPNDPARNYAIPFFNPFAHSDGADEIWAYGLRNPWRCSFDRFNGDLYIADVGQFSREEVNLQPLGVGGRNYGWRCVEGEECTGLPGCDCRDPAWIEPIHSYGHEPGCAITGGYVYRGCAIPDLEGAYFFADYCSGRIWSLRADGREILELLDRTEELNDGEVPIGAISSFGENARGEILLCDHVNGNVFEIVAQAPAADCNGNGQADGCEVLDDPSLDLNGDGIPDACGSVNTILRSDPPNRAVDARQPWGIDGGNVAGWSQVVLTFTGYAEAVTMSDFAIQFDGPPGGAPIIGGLEPAGVHRLAVVLDRPLPPCSRLTIQHLPSGGTVVLSAIPGDVNADGLADATDVMGLVLKLNSSDFTPLRSADVNRSDRPDSVDLVHIVDVIHRAGAYAALGKCSPMP